ncbi:hypothetical protein SUGI_0696310 [Cryptomeria japonica]|nr:hypothetical protein SUGI_0696310 [Cryptomeria japonica]
MAFSSGMNPPSNDCLPCTELETFYPPDTAAPAAVFSSFPEGRTPCRPPAKGREETRFATENSTSPTGEVEGREVPNAKIEIAPWAGRVVASMGGKF